MVLNLIAELHKATRRYCVDRIAHWHQAYAALTAAKKGRVTSKDGSWTYTEEAYRIFPRYNVLEAIRSEVERFLPEDFGSLEQERALLVTAGKTAQNPFTTGRLHEIADAAMIEEREAFIRFVTTSKEQDWARALPLPFRRVLGGSEADKLHERFCSRWGRWYGGAVDRSPETPHLTLHIEWLDTLPGREQGLRDILGARGITRLLELRELGDSLELDLGAAMFSYNGAEGFWFRQELDWMIYSSHEGSITLGGAWLVEAVRAASPNIDRYVYP